VASLRDLRTRMRAVRQTLQVTKAMNLISTSKLRRGRRMLEDTEPYFTRIQKSMFDILSYAEKHDSNFFRGSKLENSRTAIIVIASDKGLAGAYNANVFRYVSDLCEKIENPALLLVGAVGHRHYAHTSDVILERFSFHSRLPSMEDAEKVSEYVISQYLCGAFDEVHVVYTHMYNAVKILPAEKQVLPLDTAKIQSELSGMGNLDRVKLHFEFIPSEREVFDALIPRYVKGIIYGSMVEAYASEHSARMTAMNQASKSAEEMLAGLRIIYNHVRQTNITQEMAEIIGGSSALASRD